MLGDRWSSDLRCIIIMGCRNLRHVSDAVILCIYVGGHDVHRLPGHVWINSNLMAVKRDAWFKLIVCDIWVNVVASEDRVFVLSCRRYLGIWTSLVPESCWHFNSFVFSVSCSVLVFLVFDVCWSRMRLCKNITSVSVMWHVAVCVDVEFRFAFQQHALIHSFIVAFAAVRVRE